MRQIRAILRKQIKDTLKNRTVLIQFILFPLITVVMNCAVNIEGMPENYFTKMFAVMYVGMAPLTALSAVVSEEKEKGTLKALRMAGVKPAEYLIGVGGCVWILCMAGSLVIALSGGYEGTALAGFLCVMAAGILISSLMGAAVGVHAASQMAAASVSVPLMLVFAFLPMLSMFNETVEKIAKFTYTQQLQIFLSAGGCDTIKAENWLIAAANALVILLLFGLTYRKNGLE